MATKAPAATILDSKLKSTFTNTSRHMLLLSEGPSLATLGLVGSSILSTGKVKARSHPLFLLLIHGNERFAYELEL